MYYKSNVNDCKKMVHYAILDHSSFIPLISYILQQHGLTNLIVVSLNLGPWNYVW
jgi:hypothetical protein